jgi:hypothetical protein
MDEGRKRVLLIATSILAARKPQKVDGVRKVPSTVSAVADAVQWAEEVIMGNLGTDGTFTGSSEM